VSPQKTLTSISANGAILLRHSQDGSTPFFKLYISESPDPMQAILFYFIFLLSLAVWQQQHSVNHGDRLCQWKTLIFKPLPPQI